MSAKITPGQNARAIRNTRSADGVEVVKNAQVTVEALPDVPFPTFVARLEGQTGLIFDLADFEAVEPPAPYKAPISDTPAAFPLSEVAWLDDTTPAPLDPSKVKAGDTVTLTVDPPDTHPAFTVAGETHSLGGSAVYVGGWRVDDLPDYVTLTAHQPAPEPEVKPEPGMSGTATVEGQPGTRGVWLRSLGGRLWFAAYEAATSSGNLADAEEVSDFVPDEPRPLPTREQVAEAIMAADKATGNYGLYPDVATKAADAVLALLRGESR